MNINREELAVLNNIWQEKTFEANELVESILFVCEKTEWDLGKARLELENAYMEGISYKQYIEHECWNLKKDRANIVKTRDSYADEICNNTGCNKIEALNKLKTGRKYGINGASYIKYRGYEFSDEELLELANILKQRKLKEIENKEWYINVTQERIQCDRESAIQYLELAKSKGYSYRKFLTEALYKLDICNIEKLEHYKKKVVPNKSIDREAIDKAKKLKNEYRNTIKNEMGWSDARIDLEYLKSKIISGASFSEWFLFGLYKLPVEEGKKYITMETHLKMQLRYIDFKGTQTIFENKTEFNKRFGNYINRKWFNNEGLTFKGFEDRIKGFNKIIYKPIQGIEGIGIKVYEVNKNKRQNLIVFNEIMSAGLGNIEEFITQHEALNEFWPNSVNTIRLMTICKNGKGHILNAVIKFGTKANVDNYHQDGIAAGIDIKTGKICTDGVNRHGELFKAHPYSQKSFRGFKIPNWEKVVELCEAISCEIKDMPYVGWDVAIKANGEPELIEGNHNQGAYLIQYSFAVSNQEGRRHTINPYLWF